MQKLCVCRIQNVPGRRRHRFRAPEGTPRSTGSSIPVLWPPHEGTGRILRSSLLFRSLRHDSYDYLGAVSLVGRRMKAGAADAAVRRRRSRAWSTVKILKRVRISSSVTRRDVENEGPVGPARYPLTGKGISVKLRDAVTGYSRQRNPRTTTRRRSPSSLALLHHCRGAVGISS